jgi:glycosyltransferase involved in cell wall biosynthesis
MHAAPLIGEIESPRPLRAPAGRISVAGWCVVRGEATPPPVRLVVDQTILPARGGRERPDVAGLLPSEPAARRAGFVVEGELPAGVHLGRFEARLPGGVWHAFREFTIAVEAAPFAAALDTPISTGILRDRVKVGGWALDPRSEITELTLRYGHREIACAVGQPRTDVPAAFPHVPHAARAGFTSADFLVAGHGSVRIRARLADGRTAVAATPVTFSVDRDENHDPALALTAPRIPLVEDRRPHVLPPPTPAAQPLNVLLVLPGSFAANHALHVAALANELAAAGHACAVAVARDPATLAHLDRPAFRGLTHAEARRDPGFPNGRGPDIVHAWTTRENVRQLAEELRTRHHSRVVVHLEDNEREVLAFALGRSATELDRLPPAELDRLVPPDLSHPRRSREFLASCAGVTVIMDRLREFVPAGKPCVALMPAADPRHFYPRAVPAPFRTALCLPPGTTVLFYHGNVHASNAAEMRELYAAVVALNREGTPVTLLRTGLDRVDFLGDLAGAAAPHVLSLGLIQHHHHLPALMALADIFVQPGAPDAFNDYRFPSKLPEFFALGRPVVLPRTNLGHAVAHGVDAYVLDRADASGIARAVREITRDPGLAERLARGATAYAEKHFNWRRSAEALARFYPTLAIS